ncbi:MAG: TIGR04283 family arsenosugar biosynthesis glycosyltransferase, partial [Acidobacteria bacterium]|nr:TIGR04283 family arsenosugar biosynthesis glycosyltransferase [Acidobacteriota bacterium]
MGDDPLVSIVIPVWRDEAALRRTVNRLDPPTPVEVIVTSALDDEPHYEHLRQCYPRVRWTAAPRGRAVQMNAGAVVATGRWLFFLHADSALPADWFDVIAALEHREDVVAGAFRLALDSADWRARLIEASVRLRVALLGLPYGDQALFVRRPVFEAIGGYRDLPLMEDVDFVQRVRKVGRMFHCRSAVTTSTRRWERDGWMRRSLQNVSLATRFLLGTSPARLAQTYFGRKASAVVIMARAPWTAGKTRLGIAAGDAAHEKLRKALFLDTLDVVASVPNVEHIIACEPAGECERVRELLGEHVDVIAQRGSDLGERLTHVFEDVFRLGIESVVVIGSDLPDLPAGLLQDGLIALHGTDDRVVLGPAADGGYYLVGLNRPHPALFQQIEWSTDRVLAQTLDVAKT